MLHQATQAFLDWADTLPEQEKIYAFDMHEYISSKGIKPRKHIKKTYGYFDYWFKGNRVLYIRENRWRNKPLDIAIPYNLKDGKGDINSFIEILSDETDKNDLIKYVIDNICCCDRCGNKPKNCDGQWREFASVKRKLALCHNDITKFKASKTNLSYTNNDLHWLKRLVDLRIKYILKYN